MPFINVKTNLPVAPAQESALKAELGRKISALPGKTERWLMVGVEPQYHLWFAGSDAPAAMVSVSLYGDAPAEACSALTSAVTETLQAHLSLSPERVYVRYSSHAQWGWNGENF